MPQLDPSTFASQIFWLALCFGILLTFSGKVTLPRLRRVLEERAERIFGTQQLSEKLQKESEQLMREYEEEVAKARAKAHKEIISNSRQLALKHSENRFQISKKIKAQFKKRESLLIKNKATSMKGVHDIAQQITTSMVEQLAPGKSSPKAILQAVDESLKKKAKSYV